MGVLEVTTTNHIMLCCVYNKCLLYITVMHISHVPTCACKFYYLAAVINMTGFKLMILSVLKNNGLITVTQFIITLIISHVIMLHC